MADAKLTKIGLDAAVAQEEAAKAPAVEAAPAPDYSIPPNVSERRVVGVSKFPAPDGSVLVVTNL